MKLIFTLTLIACSITAMPSTPVEKEPEGIKIHCLNSPNDPLQEPLAYKNIRIVELKKVPFHQRIDYIKKLDMNDDYIFIQTPEKLYTYTLNGELIAQIGKKGKREDEYNELSTFYIDNKKKQITILDCTSRKLINYNFWGDYIFTDTVPRGTFKWSYQTLLAYDNKLLSNNGMGMGNEIPYFLFDLDKKEVVGHYFSYRPITTDNYLYPFSWHPMANTGKDIDLIMPLCDTIYTYSPVLPSFHPKYIIEATQKMASKDQIRSHTPSYSGDLLRLDQQGYFTGFGGIYETDTKVLLQYKYGITLGYFLFDKSSREGNYYLYSSDEKEKMLPFNVIYHAYKNDFVSYMKGEELRSLHYIKDKKIKEQIKNLRDESICLVFYELE